MNFVDYIEIFFDLYGYLLYLIISFYNMKKIKSILKLHDYIIMDKNNLSGIGVVNGYDWLFKGKRFIWILLFCFVIVSVSLFSIFNLLVHYNIKINEFKREHNKIIKSCVLVNDSLLNEMNEKERLDTFVMICYEVLTTPCPKATHDNVWEFIKKCDSWYPDIVMMQAVQESNVGKSDVAKRCNNLFGMTKPEKRKLRCDINRNNKKEKYAEYLDWRFSVIDRILWERWLFRNYNKKPSIDEYMKVIDNMYSETEGYATIVYKNAEKYRKLH